MTRVVKDFDNDFQIVVVIELMTQLHFGFPREKRGNEEFDDEEFLARKIDKKNEELTTLKSRILGVFWN